MSRREATSEAQAKTSWCMQCGGWKGGHEMLQWCAESGEGAMKCAAAGLKNWRPQRQWQRLHQPKRARQQSAGQGIKGQGAVQQGPEGAEGGGWGWEKGQLCPARKTGQDGIKWCRKGGEGRSFVGGKVRDAGGQPLR